MTMAANGGLRGVLLPQALECAPEQLLGMWKMTRLAVRATLPPLPCDFDDGPGLPGRIRGALGQALRALDADGHPSLALQVCFGPLPAWRPRSQLPRPYTIAAERRGREVFASLTLFGRFDVERERLMRAFLLAFELGLASDERSGSRRVCLSIADARWAVTQSVAEFRTDADALLLFRTPFRIGPKNRASCAWDHLVVGLVERVAGMAFWQGCSVPVDLGCWRRIAQRLEIDARGLLPIGWRRGSGRGGGRALDMSGYSGRLIIRRPPEVLLPYLALGETTLVGAHAALGLGRYDLLPTG